MGLSPVTDMEVENVHIIISKMHVELMALRQAIGVRDKQIAILRQQITEFADQTKPIVKKSPIELAKGKGKEEDKT